ncbi:MAG: nucleotidyltransferase domain-containing protein [Planctomycetota bacterium]
MTSSTQTEAQSISEMVQRIVQAVHPDKVVLFGSRARGDNGPDSDFDILIVAPSPYPRWRRAVPLYRLLGGMGVAKDIVWWTPDEVSEWKNVKSHFITRAMREGKVSCHEFQVEFFR